MCRECYFSAAKGIRAFSEMLYLKAGAGNLFLGNNTRMCNEYRLSVSPEKIVVQDRDNRRHFLQ